MLFKDVIGHNDTKLKLIKSVQKKRISHAQLFLGIEGSGNFQLALAYAQYINCVNPESTDSCGKCSSCIKYKNKQHPDLHFFYPSAVGNELKKDPSSKKLIKPWVDFLNKKEYFTLNDWMNHIGAGEKLSQLNVLDSQDILRTVSLKTFEAKFKVIIIWWPERMNIFCSNKILKVLEEPNPNSVFLLVGYNTDELLSTITSRVQIIKTGRLSDNEIIKGLIKKEGIPEDLAQSISTLANGDFSKASDLVNTPESKEQFIDLFQNWMRICYSADFLKIDKWINEIDKLGRIAQKNFLEYGLKMFRECLIYNYVNPEINRLNEREKKFNANFARFIHGGNILEIIDVFEYTHTAIGRNANRKIAFMNLSLNICNLLKSKP
ncbi:MAG: DNA polymerase III subunit delta [Flavobacteriales bacterium]|nr:DNA polymerase III subunit delta [Flavobacteriales bacterium]|tara:strand:- start:37312 stop:38445 length:1134 start_codon:yes stop_codon:yes gene_type:complete